MMKKYLYVILSCMLIIALFALAGCNKEEAVPKNESEEAKISEEAKPSETTTAEEKSLKTEYPLTLEIYNADNELVSITLKKAPERVISTQLSMTELMINLGLQDKIVGVFQNDNTLTGEIAEEIGKLNNMGDKKSISKETVLILEPDLILGKVPSMFSEKSIGTVEYYKEKGINVYTELASARIEQSLENVMKDVENIGMIFDVQDKAKAYNEELKAKLDSVKEKISGAEGERKKVVLMAGYHDGTYTSFNSAFISCLLNSLNAENAVEKGGNGFTSENLVALNPDYIIYIRADRFANVDHNAIEEIYTNDAIAGATAVKEKRIIEISYDDLMDFGARNFDTLVVLYDFLYE